MSEQQNLLNRAIELHQSGRVLEAVDLYNKALPWQQSNAQLLYLAGTANLQIGQTKKAIELIERSLAIDPRNPHARNNAGLALQVLMRPYEALQSYNKALAMKPDFAEAYYNKGNVLRDLKRLDEALASYEKALAIKPDYAEAYIDRGNVMCDLKRPDEALRSYNKALAIKPDFAEAYYNKGNVLRDLKRLDEALASYEKALAINPDLVQAHYNQGTVLRELERLDEAIASYDNALAINPHYAEVYSNRGNVLRELKRLDEALASYDKALAIKPGYAAAYYNRGIALRALNRLDEALANYDKALAINPNFVAAYCNRGATLQDLRRLDEALESYDRALAIKPDDADTNFSKSQLLLLGGRYREGWPLYEWRLKQDDAERVYYTFPQPAWRGDEDIRDKKLLIYPEQGFGDVIQFCRYLPKLHALGAELIVEVPKRLETFISTLDCPMFVVAKGERLPDFDIYCPMMSLPHAFKTTVDTIPAETPYLFSDPQKVQWWQEKLGNKVRLRVGLTWSGSTKAKSDVNRSIKLEKFLSITTSSSIEWHSLQKDYQKGDIQILSQHPEIQQHQDEFHDFSDTAALIQCLDIVISVDTSVAHVAGAMGKPVWILLPFASEHRWLLDRKESPWYPTATLYRQSKFGDWHSVITMVQQDLAKL